MQCFHSLSLVPVATLLAVTAAPVFFAAAEANAQTPAKATATAKVTPAGCDNAAINWFKPGEFEAARRLAKKDKRLLVIKGISFGVDDAGAQCATKGMW